MIDFSPENKENIKTHFLMFLDMVQHEPDKTIMPVTIAEKYIDNEIAMQEGMKQYYEDLRAIDMENHALLQEIKKEKGKIFYKYLLEIIEESEGIKGKAEIVDTALGKFQEEKWGRQIKGIWVQQWTVGMEGDSFEGFVCVQLGENRYLKFGYSM